MLIKHPTIELQAQPKGLLKTSGGDSDTLFYTVTGEPPARRLRKGGKDPAMATLSENQSGMSLSSQSWGVTGSASSHSAQGKLCCNNLSMAPGSIIWGQ